MTMTNNLITLGLNEAASKSKMTKQLKKYCKADIRQRYI